MAVGDLFDTLGYLFLAIKDRIIAALGFGDLGFFLRSDGTDYGGTQMFGPLANNLANPACSRMDKDRIAFLT